MTANDLKTRSVARTVPAQKTIEGGGVTVHRAMPTQRVGEIDPFLLFDHMGPLEVRPGEGTGFPDHPHRGFETVTYMLHGQIEHRDSFGHRGVIGPGAVQWMTAGSGLVHSEMPGAELIRDGGRLEGFQIWVNLPARDKMLQPRYQELTADQIPEAEQGGVKVKIIAGEAFGKKGGVDTRIPIQYLHFTVQPGAQHAQHVPANLNVVTYDVGAKRLTQYANDGDGVHFRNDGSEPIDVLLLAGEPLNEPIARYGPFVMNTREQVMQAMEDYRNGKMGTI